MSARSYTIVTFDIEGFTQPKNDADSHKLQAKLETDLNDLAKAGWKIIGQSLLAGDKQRILYTLEKEKKHGR